MLISGFTNCGVMEKVTDMEQRYGINLPAQYKDFLHRYNGGYTPKTRFRAGKISSDLRVFFGLGNVGLSMESIELKEWLENGIFPVACDSFGNHIAIGLSDEKGGKIYFCDHEKGNKAEYIAANLRDFCKCCKSEKISEASRRTIQEREEDLIARGRGDIITDALRQMWQAEIDKYGDMIQEELRI